MVPRHGLTSLFPAARVTCAKAFVAFHPFNVKPHQPQCHIRVFWSGPPRRSIFSKSHTDLRDGFFADEEAEVGHVTTLAPLVPSSEKSSSSTSGGLLCELMLLLEEDLQVRNETKRTGKVDIIWDGQNTLHINNQQVKRRGESVRWRGEPRFSPPSRHFWIWDYTHQRGEMEKRAQQSAKTTPNSDSGHNNSTFTVLFYLR